MTRHPQYQHDSDRRLDKARERFDGIRAEPLQSPTFPATRAKVPNLVPGRYRALLFRKDGKLYVAEVGCPIGRRFSSTTVLAIHHRGEDHHIWTEDRHPAHGGPIVLRRDDVVDAVPYEV